MRVQDWLPLTVVLLLVSSADVPQAYSADYTPTRLFFNVYGDGVVSVDYSVDVDPTLVRVNVSIFGTVLRDVLVIDQNGLSLNYAVSGSVIEVDSLGSISVTITYSTPDLTSKIGSLWIFNASTPTTSMVSLPAGSTITSLSNVPLEIGTLNGNPYISMPAGRTEICYIAHAYEAASQGLNYLTIVAIVVAAIIIAAVVLVLRRRREAEPAAEPKTKVDLQVIFDRNPSLRMDDREVLRFVAESGGEAFANEIRERFGLPRTSAWRMFRRLIGMGIVEEIKIGGQSLIRISRRYREGGD